MNHKLKIPVQRFIKDLNTSQLSDQNVMEKYGLDFRQMIFVLGKLAEKRKISFKRVVFVVRAYLDAGELEKAEICLKIMKKYFDGIWGVQALVKSLEHDLVSLRNRTAFQQKMDGRSKSLESFRLKYPEISLHPAVVSSVKVLDYHMDTINQKEKLSPEMLKFLDTRWRLKIYPKNIQKFSDLNSTDALRLWHYLSLKLFYRENISWFVIRGMMDADTRDVCMHLDGTCLPVAEVISKANEDHEVGKVLSENSFPSLMSVEDLSANQKPKILMENGWYLPPFCENCRCQILPCQQFPVNDFVAERLLKP